MIHEEANQETPNSPSELPPLNNKKKQVEHNSAKPIGILDMDPNNLIDKPFFTEPETVEAMSQLGYTPEDLLIMDTNNIQELPPQDDIRNTVREELDKRRIQMIQNIIKKRNEIINNPKNENQTNPQNELGKKKKKKGGKGKKAKNKDKNSLRRKKNDDDDSENDDNDSKLSVKKQGRKSNRRIHVDHTDEEIKEMVQATHHLNRPAPISDPPYNPSKLKKRKKKQEDL